VKAVRIAGEVKVVMGAASLGRLVTRSSLCGTARASLVILHCLSELCLASPGAHRGVESSSEKLIALHSNCEGVRSDGVEEGD
jgi:hypothetical protein